MHAIVYSPSKALYETAEVLYYSPAEIFADLHAALGWRYRPGVLDTNVGEHHKVSLAWQVCFAYLSGLCLTREAEVVALRTFLYRVEPRKLGPFNTALIDNALLEELKYTASFDPEAESFIQSLRAANMKYFAEGPVVADRL